MAPRKATKRQGAQPNRKRKRNNAVDNGTTAGSSNAPEAVTRSEERRKGKRLMVFGDNICGQLGFDCERRKFPALVPSLASKQFKAVACGGLHTLALESNGNLWSFGNNDECALGRETEDEEEEEEGEEDGDTIPGLVQVPGRIISISAGDSHSAALTASGKVFAWGVFRDNNGKFGLVPDQGPLCKAAPVEISCGLNVKITQIASGSHHLAMIGADGKVYTCGANDEGQLGRINPQRGPMRYTRNTSFIIDNGIVAVAQARRRQHKVFCLTPSEVKIGRGPKIGSITCGEFSTIMLSRTGKDVYVCGLNNYGQLGIPNFDEMSNNIRTPTKNNEFQGIVWKQIAAGLHHTIALDRQGLVYSLGRNHNGRLGLGSDGPGTDSVHVPQIIDILALAEVVHLAAGSNTSYAITSQGMLCSWGMGTHYQLAAGDDRDVHLPGLCIGKRERDPEGNKIDSLIDGEVLSVEGGGQHVGLIVSKFD